MIKNVWEAKLHINSPDGMFHRWERLCLSYSEAYKFIRNMMQWYVNPEEDKIVQVSIRQGQKYFKDDA